LNGLDILPHMSGMPVPVQPSASPWRRRGRRIAIVLAAALACLVLLCCAGAAYIVYDARRAPNAQREMAAFADDLCRDLLDGDADAVYAALSVGARDRYTVQELTKGLAARGRLTRCEVARTVFLYLLRAYVVIEDAHGRHTFDLVSESGEWKVESDILQDLDSPPRHGGGGFGDGD
jgi:hypothetical protein